MTLLISFFITLAWTSSATTLITEPIQTPNGVTIHKRSGMIFDVEAPAEHVWLDCYPDNPKEKNSFFFAYLLDGDKLYQFLYRRVYSRAMCLDEKKAYRNLIRGAKTVRLVGMGHGMEDAPDGEHSPNIPKHFHAATQQIIYMFVRLQAGKKCKAFFSTDCDLPENYWAGTTPNAPFR